jgi:hypothetical protein
MDCANSGGLSLAAPPGSAGELFSTLVESEPLPPKRDAVPIVVLGASSQRILAIRALLVSVTRSLAQRTKLRKSKRRKSFAFEREFGIEVGQGTHDVCVRDKVWAISWSPSTKPGFVSVKAKRKLMEQDAFELLLEFERLYPDSGTNACDWEGREAFMQEALLMDSLADLTDPSCKPGSDKHRDLWTWIHGTDRQRKQPFSFDSCTAAAGYDPASLRDALRVYIKGVGGSTRRISNAEMKAALAAMNLR